MYGGHAMAWPSSMGHSTGKVGRKGQKCPRLSAAGRTQSRATDQQIGEPCGRNVLRNGQTRFNSGAPLRVGGGHLRLGEGAAGKTSCLGRAYSTAQKG